MIETLRALVLDESKWLTASLALALAMVAWKLWRHRRDETTPRHRVLAAMNLSFAATIGAMAFGHLLAVTVELGQGTLRDGSLFGFYAIGVALAAPSWWLLHHAWGLFLRPTDVGTTTVALNAWLGATLLALGLHNLPLAVPAVFDIGYQIHRHRAVGWAIVAAAIALQLGLLAASLVFLASGQSFEQFSGVEPRAGG